MNRRNVFSSCFVLTALLAALIPLGFAREGAAASSAGSTPTHTLRLSSDPSKPLFSVGIQGGFIGAVMTATVYGDGRVQTVRQGAGRPVRSAVVTVPLSRSALKKVVQLAQRTRVFALPKSLQDQQFGADIPVLSLRLYTTSGIKSVHATGGENSHVKGTEAFFPIWGLLYALAGYPSQLG
jgi:hypothetical protein